ncbi:MAG: DUF2207 domain-containing protein [Candidatus Geothermincolia bacterium]
MMSRRSQQCRRALLLAVTVLLACAFLAALVPCAAGAADNPPGVQAGSGVEVAQVKSWDFERFDTDITVNKDGSLTVRETQVANFTGSFSFLNRDLTSSKGSFTDGRTYGQVRFKDIKVFSLDGTPYGNWKVLKMRGGRRVQISFSATNQQMGWIVEYKMTGAVIYAKNYDRIYFNTVSYDRDVPIKSSRSTVTLPGGTDMSKVKTVTYGSKTVPPGASTSGVEGNTLWWETKTIAPFTTLTIDVAFPKGIVQIPLTYRSGFGILVIVLVVIAVVAVAGGMIWRWSKKGRDIKPEVTVVQYEPPADMRPAEVGMLLNETPLIGDITATIVDLAVRGKLIITEQEGTGLLKHKTFGFEKLDTDFSDLSQFEAEVVDGLFESGPTVTEDDLKDKFYVHIAAFDRELKEQALSKGLWDGDPAKVKGHYTTIALVLLLLIIPTYLLRAWIDLGYLVALIPGLAVCGVVVFIVGRYMPRRTAKGAEEYAYVLGFKEYMATAEQEEMKFMTPENFQTNLPYAMRLGVADKWAGKFAEIYTEPPSWYRGYYPGTFSTIYLASALSDMNSSVSGTLASSPSSSGGGGGGFGGGFSGGGFGGGGSSAG